MPRQIFPKQSGSHRVACKALYRALLEQVPRIEIPPSTLRGPINPIKHIIRTQFRRNQHLTSVRLTVAALKIGNEAEELLRAAGDGESSANSRVIRLLEEIQSQGNYDRVRRATEPATPRKPRPQVPAPYPGAVKVLESRPRPLSELSGERRVPKLVNANGRPFLRIKKPQGEFVSRVIRDKINQKEDRMAHIRRMEEEVLWTEGEDYWERIVTDNQRGEEEGGSWSVEVQDSIRDYTRRISAEDQLIIETSKKMLRIVDQEMELAAQEKREREEREKKVEEKPSGEKKTDGNLNPVMWKPVNPVEI